jgi:hypothetical protein
MKFGIFYEHQIPRPWHEDSEYDLLNQSLEQICSSLELFAAEVMPEFHEREPQHQEWKQAVLAGDIQLSEIDTGPQTPRSLQTPANKN